MYDPATVRPSGLVFACSLLFLYSLFSSYNGRVDDFSFFDYSSPFCFSLIEFHPTLFHLRCIIGHLTWPIIIIIVFPPQGAVDEIYVQVRFVR